MAVDILSAGNSCQLSRGFHEGPTICLNGFSLWGDELVHQIVARMTCLTGERD
jgi:hypothetical protein